MSDQNKQKQIKTRIRVQKHGEVNTNIREVRSMLNLVQSESERIDSRFLEPACGDGNFISEILQRKINSNINKNKKNRSIFDANMIICFGSIYGIDLLIDNIEIAKERLINVFFDNYQINIGNKPSDDLVNSIKYVMNKNIIHGDALTLKKVNSDEEIIFSEWSLFSGKIKRRDYIFKELVSYSPFEAGTLFSDLGDEVFINKPIKDFNLCKYDLIYKYD